MQATHLHLLRGKGRNFFLDILFHRMSANACSRQLSSAAILIELYFAIAHGNAGLLDFSPSRLNFEFGRGSCASRFGLQSVAYPTSGCSSTLAKHHRSHGGVTPCTRVAVVRCRYG
jgi:hypothetical protein